MRSSTWEVSISSAQVVAKRIKEDLVGPLASQSSPEALSAEVIRVALWALCAHRQTSSFSEASVNTRRLLELARAIWMPIADVNRDGYIAEDPKLDGELEKNVQLSRELLDTLAEQGDLFALSGGRWLPAPQRFVSIAPTHYLLVGGLPTHLLPRELLRALHLHGSFRHIDGSATSSLQDPRPNIHWQFQPLQSWLGPSQKLEELIQQFDEYELQNVSHQNVSDTSLEAYVADIDQPQLLRWKPLSHAGDGRFLLRTNTPWGGHQYSIGFISRRKLTQQSNSLWQIDIRRLCYALDNRAGRPTRLRWDEGKRELLLRSELPGRERKFLSSIGTLRENVDGNYYPRKWFIPADVTAVFMLLKDLGISVEMD